MIERMKKLYEPYVLLNGEWSYDKYLKICEELGITPDSYVTTFTDRIGFLVAAIYNFPNENVYKSILDFSKEASMKHAERMGVMTPQVPASELVIKPCCGGGQVR